jgi:hypothetical protein
MYILLIAVTNAGHTTNFLQNRYLYIVLTVAGDWSINMYMMPRPKTKEDIYSRISRNKPVDKTSQLKTIIESSEYRKWQEERENTLRERIFKFEVSVDNFWAFYDNTNQLPY